jgi:hypothetical protein
MDDDQGSGWLAFAAIILMTAGIMRFFDSIWAFRTNLQITDDGGPLGDELGAYGVLWMLAAVVLFVAGLLVLQRNQFARWIGIAAGAFGAITAALYLPYAPVWAMVYILIGVLVIYGLAAHGGPLEFPTTGSSSTDNTP